MKSILELALDARDFLRAIRDANSLYFDVLRRPFAFVEQVDGAAAPLRKAALRFFFSASTLSAFVQIYMFRTLERHGLASLCSSWSNQINFILTKEKMSLLSLASYFSILIVTYYLFKIFERSEVSLTSFATLLLINLGFSVISISILQTIVWVSIDQLASEFGSEIFNNCGDSTTTYIIEGFTFDGSNIRSKGETVLSDPMAIAESSVAFILMTSASWLLLPVSLLLFVMIVSWVMHIFKTSWLNSLLTILVSCVPLAVISTLLPPLFAYFSKELDKFVPLALRDLVELIVGF